MLKPDLSTFRPGQAAALADAMLLAGMMLAGALMAAPLAGAQEPQTGAPGKPAVLSNLPSDTPPTDGRAPMSDTIKAAVDNGYKMVLTDGQKVDIDFEAGGLLGGVLSQLGGTWWADGAELCINVPGFAENQCLTWPAGKRSGDTFGIQVKSGVIMMTIK